MLLSSGGVGTSTNRLGNTVVALSADCIFGRCRTPDPLWSSYVLRTSADSQSNMRASSAITMRTRSDLQSVERLTMQG